MNWGVLRTDKGSHGQARPEEFQSMTLRLSGEPNHSIAQLDWTVDALLLIARPPLQQGTPHGSGRAKKGCVGEPAAGHVHAVSGERDRALLILG